MDCYIDGNRRPERNFWHELQGIASEQQRKRLLDENKIIIGGRKFEIVKEASTNQ